MVSVLGAGGLAVAVAPEMAPARSSRTAVPPLPPPSEVTSLRSTSCISANEPRWMVMTSLW